jgi:hypothetical protein
MNVAPVVDQLRAALTERTRLENDFKTKILNRINAILEQLNDCDRANLPPTAAGVLDIAVEDLNAIVREIRNPTNMTDAHVEEIVEPLDRRRRNNTVRLLPEGRPVDGPRLLSAPPAASALTGRRSPFSIGSWFSRPQAEEVELGRLRTPDRPAIQRQRSDPDNLDDLDEADYPDFPGGPLGRGRVAPGTRIGGKRTRRKYHRKA